MTPKEAAAARRIGRLLVAAFNSDAMRAELWRRARAECYRRAKGGRGAAKARERNLGREGWRREALRLDSMMTGDLVERTRKERAILIARRLGDVITWRVIYNALPARRPRKSSHSR